MSEPLRTATVPAAYNEAFAATRGSLRGSPGRRAAAFARFTELGFPGPREETWKYTSLRRLESRRFAPVSHEQALAAQVADVESLGEHRLTLVNGHLRADLSRLDRLPAGVRIRTLRDGTVADDFDARVLRVLPGGGTERFTALNAALSAEPVLVEVDAGTRCDEVLHLVLQATGAEATMSHPRAVVRLGAGSRLRVVLHYAGDGLAERFVNSVLELDLADEAELQLYRLQAHGSRTFHIDRCDATLGRQARLVVRDAQLGGALARLDLNVTLSGRAAVAEVTGIFLADGARHLDTHLRIDHRAVETWSLLDYRGIAAGRGRAVFNGKAVVHQGAQQSHARQSSRNLLLTPGAEIDTKPELEIYADDVQCSHGATTGQLDPTALFYLRSRGLSEVEARSALTRAFAGAVLSRVDLPALATLVRDTLDARLVQLLEGPT